MSQRILDVIIFVEECVVPDKKVQVFAPVTVNLTTADTAPSIRLSGDGRRNDECSGICLKYEGNPNCCRPTCPSQCMKAYKDKVTLEECRQYELEYENCFYEACPQYCRDSVARGEQNDDCKQYLGDTQCYIRTDCPNECQQKALWGECPAQCKEFMGNPDCCAPTCPAKCTNKRRGSCEASGAEECGGIPGCCPEHFDQVFGAGVYLPPPANN